MRSLATLSTSLVLLVLCCPATGAVKVDDKDIDETSEEWLVIIANNPFATSVLIPMRDSGDRDFKFTDVAHAGKHINIRKEIVGAMNQMQNNGIDFVFTARHNDVVLPSPYMRLIPKLGIPQFGALGYLFEVCPGAPLKPADAVALIEIGTTRNDCLTGAHSAVLIGHRRALGDVAFNALFPVGHLLKIDGKIRFADPPMSLPATTTPPVVIRQHIPGDVLYMQNHPDYPKSGGEQGENCICVGADSYSGLGNGYQNLSQAALKEKLIVAFDRAFEDEFVPRKMTRAEREQVRFTDLSRIRILP